MNKPRIYQNTALVVNERVTLNVTAMHHVRAFRLKEKSELFLFNNSGGDYLVEISQLTKNKIEVIVKAYREVNLESPINIHLGQGISRGEKMDFTIQKAVELGVKKITPLFTERCGVKLSAERMQKRLKHWQAVVISACEQSGRAYILTINEPMDLAEWVSMQDDGLSLVLDPEAEQSIANLKPSNANYRLLIGSEGGLSEAEIETAIAHNFAAIRLGPRILRTETAALAAVSAIQCLWGDFMT